MIIACALAAFLFAALSPDDVRGLTQNRALLKGSPVVVVFLSAKCPVSNTYGERLQRVYDDYRARGVRFFFVNSNQNETEAEIGHNSREHGFTFPIFQDHGSIAADRFGAQATPEVFLLDRESNVAYHGAVDDSQNPARIRRQALRDALDQILAGQRVTLPELKSFGCTIKRPRLAVP